MENFQKSIQLNSELLTEVSKVWKKSPHDFFVLTYARNKDDNSCYVQTDGTMLTAQDLSNIAMGVMATLTRMYEGAVHKENPDAPPPGFIHPPNPPSIREF